jgi:immunity protein 53 of polymorphic toxin system
VNNIQKLQLWYSKQCDSSWEHQYGVSIDTLDNPGWTMIVDLTGTDLQSMQMEPIIEEKTEQDWLQCKIEDGKFVGNGGPLKLDAILDSFLALLPRELTPED